MTRKDFRLIASVLNDAYHAANDDAGMVLFIMERFASALARINPAFDRQRFIEACKR